MLIDFEKIHRVDMDNYRGGDKFTHARMFTDDYNCVSKVTLEPEASIGLHRHTASSEIIFVISGKARMICDGVTEVLINGECAYCPVGSEHTIINDGEDEFIFISAIAEHFLPAPAADISDEIFDDYKEDE